MFQSMPKMYLPRYFNRIVLFICILMGRLDNYSAQQYLSVSGMKLTLHGEKVFLSGMNQAWYSYGADFGNDGYAKSKPHLMTTLDAIRQNGGNSIRIWVHVVGVNTPQFNDTGHVVGPGANLTRDLQDFLWEARSRNILVTFSLWNGAALTKALPLYSVLTDRSVLQSYLENALTPLVRALKSEVGLGIWEIINEPEGSMQMGMDDKEQPCYDTSTIHIWDGADWTGLGIPLKDILAFVALQADTIHKEDPKALVTVGSWTYKTISDQLSRRNFYSDKCLQEVAGGSVTARLDLYQIHTYDTLHLYLPHDPFMVNASVYKLEKPVIIGEFSQKRGASMTSPGQFNWAYYHGYSGSWSWSALGSDDAADSLEVQESGIRSLQNKNEQNFGGRVNFTLNSSSKQRIVSLTKNVLVGIQELWKKLIAILI
ncbi:mannan endo-1,4-beta-mannosidase-like [Dreissena polymorpha]|uniref:Mannan endo-1,4-beta-mannosidase n=1 Tax=Dreissena polymorpha TaxID=45954 RepID=A0A9D4FH75_DREPO|nr:mannan endo-1,4-beta-mannosidase-like [Dreissena polymorpha]XP_052219638.1 mannan endo-1,4-beta-mannosidase-like [Dreissena polymorpha]XP_052219639.1 mannan endo-1,4-beta-mannosidase-like [Dreissena polymorpha]KAH3796485.1 hypothetical protein DPMN_150053 [Dreissena polymorpha]